MKFKIYTLGCKVNQYESQSIREAFVTAGYEDSADAPADFYVINTCTVTHTADVKSIKYIRKAKKENPAAKIAAIGCLVDRDWQRLERERVDYLIPQQSKQEIFSIINKDNAVSASPFRITDFNHNRAFVKVQDGCDNSCSFCKVRIVRGKARSRPLGEILEEIALLTDKGFREIVLCGTDLGSWQDDKKRRIDYLLGQLIKVNNLGRIRVSSIEPCYLSAGLLELIASTDKICSHLHLPFQSGSDRILKLMNKRLNPRRYYNLIDDIRKIIPDCGISCDIMVGFPYEEDEDFQDTLNLLRKAESVRTHVFGYSPRKGTKSYLWPRIHSEIIKHRVDKAIVKAQDISFKYRNGQVGKLIKVIFDRNTGDKPVSYGYAPNYIRVRAEEAINSKELLPVKITAVDKQATHISLTVPVGTS